MSDPPGTRRPRGSYAPLICLNCRSRKIKCILPEQIKVEPSDDPQPSCTSCERCRHLGLECIVQRTILGRPAAKRKRVLAGAGQVVATGPSLPAGSSHDLDSTQVSGYLLSGAPDEDPEAHRASRRKINEREMFEALLSPARLMAAHLARDKHFGSATVPALAQRPVSLTKLVSNGMAALLDESLVWHRFYFTATPGLVNLRQEILGLVDSFGTSSYHLLFGLLCLMALESPSCRLREDAQLRQDLRAAVMHYGQQMLFTLPTHRYTLTALVVVFQYKPAVLAPSQASASAAVRGDLYIGLAKRVAERLGLNAADAALLELVSSPGDVDALRMDSCLVDALQWCQILTDEAFHDGFMTKPSSLMQDTISSIERVLSTVDIALQLYVPPLPIRYCIYEIRTSHLVAKSIAQVKRSWKDIALLTAIVDDHEVAFDAMQTDFLSTLQQPHTVQEEDKIDDGTLESTELTAAVTRLVQMDLHDKRGAMSTVAMFYGLMARLKSATTTLNNMTSTTTAPPSQTEPDTILAHEAIQVGDQVIAALKTLRIGPALEMHAFLARFGDARDARLEQILSDFVSAADGMKFDGISWLPPPKSAGLMLLLHCRLLVENNAHRMKGWGGLHERFENQAELIMRCSEKLEGMACFGTRGVDDAFADGCLHAACAKLLRCLHVIMLGWKAKLDSSSSSTTQSDGAGSAGEIAVTAAVAPESTAPQAESSSADAPGTDTSTWSFDPLDDFDFDELFGQWGNWPQADMLDFSQFMPWEDMDLS